MDGYIVGGIIFLFLMSAFFTFIGIRFPRHKEVPLKKRVKRAVISWVVGIFLVAAGYTSNYFWHTINPFVGAYAHFCVNALGVNYIETNQDVNDFAVQLSKSYVIKADFDEKLLVEIIESAYNDTNFVNSNYKIEVEDEIGKYLRFSIYDERGNCGWGKVEKFAKHSMLRLYLNLY